MRGSLFLRKLEAAKDVVLLASEPERAAIEAGGYVCGFRSNEIAKIGTS